MINTNEYIGGSYNKNDITLEDNGRLFPSWIMQNFKKYILPDIIRKSG